MTLMIHGIDVEETRYDDDLFIALWEEFLTDYLQEFSNPDVVETAPVGGEYELAFELAVRDLIYEDIMISVQWLEAIETAVYVSDYWQQRFADYAKRVRAHHAKASA